MVNSKVLDLKFDVLSDQLSAQDKLQLDGLIDDWQGVRNIQVSAVGHSDSQRIAQRNKHLFADNYALSHARAMSAAFYVAEALNVPVANIQVAGRGPDDPVADNATAAGRQRHPTMAAPETPTTVNTSATSHSNIL